MKQITNHDYFEEAFKNPYGIADRLREATKGVEFGSLVGIGMSGSSMVPILGILLDRPYAIIRKKGVLSHSTSEYVGTITEKWLFVDDLISSGKTFRTVLDTVSSNLRRYGFQSECVGSFQYARFGPGLFTPMAESSVQPSSEPKEKVCPCGCGMSASF